jgi:hypothetical protein
MGLGQEEQNQDPLLSFQQAEMKQAHMKYASVEEELDQHMLDLMEGPSFFHPDCMRTQGPSLRRCSTRASHPIIA